MSETYMIIRFWMDNAKRKTIVARGLSLDDARRNCQREDTHKDGVWFEGFTKE